MLLGMRWKEVYLSMPCMLFLGYFAIYHYFAYYLSPLFGCQQQRAAEEQKRSRELGSARSELKLVTLGIDHCISCWKDMQVIYCNYQEFASLVFLQIPSHACIERLETTQHMRHSDTLWQDHFLKDNKRSNWEVSQLAISKFLKLWLTCWDLLCAQTQT